MMVFVDYLLFDPCAGSRVTSVYSERPSHEIVVNELTSWRLMTNGEWHFAAPQNLTPFWILALCFVVVCLFVF